MEKEKGTNVNFWLLLVWIFSSMTTRPLLGPQSSASSEAIVTELVTLVTRSAEPQQVEKFSCVVVVVVVVVVNVVVIAALSAV